MRVPDYENPDLHDPTAPDTFDRREFLQRLGGGIIIIVTLSDPAAWAARAGGGGGRSYPEDFNAYLRIGEDGRVACFTGKIEMGQGPITSLAQMLADELDVTMDVVDMVMGDTDRCPWDMGTFGSMTTRFFGPPLRAAGAEARRVLMELASESLKVPVENLATRNGVVYEKGREKNQVSYGQLAKGKTIERRLKVKPETKSVAEFQIIGKSYTRTDALEKVTGRAKFAGDLREEGMLYARLLRPPAHGAKLKSADTSDAEKIEGVKVVRDGDMIAVLHPLPDMAQKALEAIKAEFDVPAPRVNDKTIFDHLVKNAGQGKPVRQGGNLAEGEKLAKTLVEATYLNSYVAHAPMEPHTALARMDGDKITVWASTQTPFPLKSQIASALKMPEGNVRVLTPFVGGGFGGKSANQQAIEAARLAKLTGRPVQVAWSRQEEFFYDTFRPAAVVKIKSGLEPSGKIVLWDYNVYFAGSRGADQFYAIPHHRTLATGEWRGEGGPHPFATGAWRAPGNNTNTFARECHMDIMAAKAGMDPIEFRLKNLEDPKIIRVLKAAAEKFGWKPAKSPSGRGFGVAVGMDSGTWVAHIAEVEVNRETGAVRVKRVVCAQDMGLVINPQGAIIQMEGCIMMGLGYALTEEIHFEGGRVLDTDFGTYVIPRFSWLPKIETMLVGANEPPAQGGGEPAIICMGAVIANAIYDAVGARLFQLPMTPERVKAALAAQPVG
ncbi:MAG: molybdopterin-dependent oxidoreductase [Candidatus Sumerlaeia bacterium]|nr:molybdopterin-dependent oxidoreductase [Candidatus Sumerlaeia bacterium]